MSAELVGWALSSQAGPLSPRAGLVLVVMCHNARAEASGDVPARTYYGGWERLAEVLDREHRLGPSGRKSAVARAVAELVAAKCVKPVDNPGGGRRACYQIRDW